MKVTKRLNEIYNNMAKKKEKKINKAPAQDKNLDGSPPSAASSPSNYTI